MTGTRPADAPSLDARLYTYVSRETARRLRLYQALTDQPVAHIVNDILSGHLPSLSELASGITDGVTSNAQSA